MLKKLTSQEIFIVISAIFTLLFMYSTIILSADNEKYEQKEQMFSYEENEDKLVKDSYAMVHYQDDVDE
ncbi:hypothetical protein [Halalkalibacter urbisdiaboli]|uniref:hypothetical protein n=1 Tax=Halalkalibacter urbisdiaboli TaxID=1960589 RepID=UPI000B43F2DE|nr:hypothetical protein [Halalkalibacter urbisdiaboli]